MGSIYRTTNPSEYDEVDGIIISETEPVAGIKGVGTGTVIMVGQFQRGGVGLKPMADIDAVHLEYGKSSYLGNVQLKNKKFSALKLIRVIASDAVKGFKTFTSTGPVNRITFTAKHKGVYGNSIKVKIEAGTISGKKYTITDENVGASAIFPEEIFDNIAIASIVSATFSSSKLVDVTVVSSVAEPDNIAATALATGSDGTIANTDYEAAIAFAEAEGAGNILFADAPNQTINSYLKIHAGLTQDKMVVCAEEEADLTTDNETDVASLRDSDGRIIYAVNWVQTLIDGVSVYTNPASWVASILSQTAPEIDPARSTNTQYLFGVSGLKKNLKRDDYKRLMAAGCMAFEQDLDIGFKIKSGIVTQIASDAKVTVLRRRMADFLENSIARYLKIYQGDVNSAEKRAAAAGAVIAFDDSMVRLKRLPGDSEMPVGQKARLIDSTSLNTSDSIAQGKFFLKYKRRIYSSMRFIVLIAEIGTGVIVTESDEA